MVEVFICSVLHAIGQEDEAVGVVADLVARSREEHISGYVLASALLLTATSRGPSTISNRRCKIEIHSCQAREASPDSVRCTANPVSA